MSKKDGAIRDLILIKIDILSGLSQSVFALTS
jgi:hypothetical protein